MISSSCGIGRLLFDTTDYTTVVLTDVSVLDLVHVATCTLARSSEYYMYVLLEYLLAVLQY